MIDYASSNLLKPLYMASKAWACAIALALVVGCTKEQSEPSEPSQRLSQQRVSPATVADGAASLVTLTVGVVPQQAASMLAKQWMPLLRHVGAVANVRLVFKTASDIPTFEQRCSAGDYDIAYMNPYHYTVFHDEVGYEAIAKRSGSKIKGILVKKRGSSLKSIQDLDGADLAFPAPRAFAATLLNSAGLRAAGVDFTSHYVSSHDSVYLNVVKGKYVAGGGIVRTFRSLKSDLRDQLEILWETPEYTPHAFAAHPRVDAKSLAAVTQALIELGNHDVGRQLLSPLKIKTLEAASNQDWDDVRSLRIQNR